MNLFLWALQILLAIHTAIGAFWKFSNPIAEAMPTLKANPQGVWIGLGVLELLCCVGLVLPALGSRFGFAVPAAALFIAVEMLLLSGVHLASGSRIFSPIIYWGAVAVFCAFIAYGRTALKPF